MSNVKKKKKRLKRRVLLFIDLILLIILAGFGYFIYITSKTQLDTSGDSSIVTNDLNSEEIGGYRNIAIFGVDSRDNALEP